MLDESLKRQLLDAASEVRQRAYAPYSGFHVGAALAGKSGTVYLGCNVENASYGLTICAERIAMGNAVTAGERELLGICISSAGGVSPCGACRQFLFEFAPDLIVLQWDADSDKLVAESSLRELLPNSFQL